VKWKELARRAIAERERLKRWWLPPLVFAMLVIDAATLASGSVVGMVLWPFDGVRQATLVWRMPAYRVEGRATLFGTSGAPMIGAAEYRLDVLRRPIWAATNFSPGAINVTAEAGERLTGREVTQVASELRTIIARRLGSSAQTIPVSSRRRPIDVLGLLGLLHNFVTLVVVGAGLYATPAFFRALGRVRDRINRAIAPKTPDEIRQDKLRKGQCPGCRYDVRGLVENRCPECGQRWAMDEHVLIPELVRTQAQQD
jgi:hypothetical protein